MKRRFLPVLLTIAALGSGCAANPEIYSPVGTVRYSALGADPFWMVTIGDDRIVLTLGDEGGRADGALESYFKTVRSEHPRGIEAIDMARRGLHNEAAELLQECLQGKVTMDFDTARRLFTLICVLHIKQSTTAVGAHPPEVRSRAG